MSTQLNKKSVARNYAFLAVMLGSMILGSIVGWIFPEVRDANDEVISYLDRQNLIRKFADFAQKEGLKKRNLMLYKSRNLFKRTIYAHIISNTKETEQFYEFINRDDPAIEKAVEILAEGKAFPEAPQETENEKD